MSQPASWPDAGFTDCGNPHAAHNSNATSTSSYQHGYPQPALAGAAAGLTYSSYGAVPSLQQPVVGIPIQQPGLYGMYGHQQQPQSNQQQYIVPAPAISANVTTSQRRMRRCVVLALAVSSAVMIVLCLVGLAAPFVTFYTTRAMAPVTGTFALDMNVFRYSMRDGGVFSGTIDDLYCDDLFNPIVFARAAVLQTFALSLVYAALNIGRLVSPVGHGAGPIVLFTQGTCALIAMICEANAASTFNYNQPQPSDYTLPFDPKSAHCPMYNLLTGTLQVGWGAMLTVMIGCAILFVIEIAVNCCCKTGNTVFMPGEIVDDQQAPLAWQQQGSLPPSVSRSPVKTFMERAARLWLLALSCVGFALCIAGLSSSVLIATSDSKLFTNGPLVLDIGLVHYTFTTPSTSSSASINTLACDSPLLSNLQAARICVVLALVITAAYSVLHLFRLTRPSPNLHKIVGVLLTLAWGFCLLVAICCEGVSRSNPGDYGNKSFIVFDPQMTPCSYLNMFYNKDAQGLVANFVGLFLAWMAFMSELGIL